MKGWASLSIRLLNSLPKFAAKLWRVENHDEETPIKEKWHFLYDLPQYTNCQMTSNPQIGKSLQHYWMKSEYLNIIFDSL